MKEPKYAYRSATEEEKQHSYSMQLQEFTLVLENTVLRQTRDKGRKERGDTNNIIDEIIKKVIS